MNSIVSKTIIITSIIALIVGFSGGYEWQNLHATAPVPTVPLQTADPTNPAETPFSILMDSCRVDDVFPTEVDAHVAQAKAAADAATIALPGDVKKLGDDIASHIESPAFGNGLLNAIYASGAADPNAKVDVSKIVRDYLTTDLNPFAIRFKGLMSQYTNIAGQVALPPLLQKLEKLDHHFAKKYQTGLTSRNGSFTGSAGVDGSVFGGLNGDAKINLSANILNDFIVLNAGYQCGFEGRALSGSSVYGHGNANIILNIITTKYGTILGSYDLLAGKGDFRFNLSKKWTF